jgi:hypothetical protein
VSFGRQRRSQVQSFPRKRESTPQASGNAPPPDWIPAFVGMTIVSKGTPFQMTPAPKRRLQAKRKPVRSNATLRGQLLRNHFGLREEQKVVTAPGFRVCP